MIVYLLVEEWGEYSNYSKTIVGVYSTPALAMAAKPDVSWSEDMTATTHSGQYHGPGGCFQCQTDWSVVEFTVDD